MKYVITGGAGNISRPLTEALLAAGKDVTVIGRNAENLSELAAKGAKAAIGSLEDQQFVSDTFKEADAVYLMIPPNFSGVDLRTYQNQVGDIFINALKESNIKHAVVLSSIGAHMGNGAGPIDGLSDFEKKLATLDQLNIKILRPSYFITNFYSMVPLIKGMNIMGSNFGGNERKLVLTHPADIAVVAAEELLALEFKGQTVRYVASDERTPEEAAAVIGKAINKQDLSWVPFTDEQANDGMLQAGLPKTIVDGYVAMGKALKTGALEEDYWNHHPVLGKVKLEDFAKEFAAAYQS